MTIGIKIIIGIVAVALAIGGVTAAMEAIKLAFYATIPGVVAILSISMLVGSVIGAVVGIVSLFKSGSTLAVKIVVTVLILVVLGLELGFGIPGLIRIINTLRA